MEDIQARIATVLPKLRVHKLEVGFLSMAVLSLVAGAGLLVFNLTRPAPKHSLRYPKASINAAGNSATPRTASDDANESGAGDLAVDIAGAVSEPGVYQLPTGARLNDAVRKAGGLSEFANLSYISRSLNLSEHITDQQKIYIPSLGEEPPEAGSNPPESAILQKPQVSPSESPFLSINSASKSELEELPGIGEITAEKIIEGRPYTSVEELSKNGVLKKNIFEGIKAKISI